MATRYWVGSGASTNWNATGNTNWATASGGANNASVPTTGDDVVFDSSSGVGASVINAVFNIRSLDCLGYIGSLSHSGSATVTISGNDSVAPGGKAFRLAAGMTYSATSGAQAIIFTSTSGTATTTSSGKTLGALTINGAGGTVQLLDALSVRSDGVVTLTAGTLDLNNQNSSIGYFSSSNSNTRVLTMGSGTMTVIGANSTIWDIATATGMTINPDTATLRFSATATSVRTVTTGGKNYPAIQVANAGTTNPDFVFATTGPTFASLSLTAPLTVGFTVGTTTTITAPLAITGVSASNFIVLKTNTNSGAQATLACPAGGTIEWAVITNIAFTGGAVTATNSFDGKGNTGISITPPSSGGGGSFGMVGG